MNDFPSSDSLALAQTGLTQRELYLFVVALNGVRPMRVDACADLPNYLSGMMCAEVGEAFQDFVQFRGNLGGIRKDGAEVPYEYSDLTEKIAQLDSVKAGYLLGFAAGFWEARALKRT